MFASVTLGEFRMNIVPLDSDVMSMEAPGSFRDVHVFGDRTDLFYAAHAIMQLQVMFGMIPRIAGKGESANHVADMLMQMRRELTDEIVVNPEIESIILIDRSVDLITPMCSQLTYEGLVSELYGITNNLAELPAHVAPPLPNGKPVKAEMHSGDKVRATPPLRTGARL